jgi:hypothetical protein
VCSDLIFQLAADIFAADGISPLFTSLEAISGFFIKEIYDDFTQPFDCWIP